METRTSSPGQFRQTRVFIIVMYRERERMGKNHYILIDVLADEIWRIINLSFVKFCYSIWFFVCNYFVGYFRRSDSRKLFIKPFSFRWINKKIYKNRRARRKNLSKNLDRNLVDQLFRNDSSPNLFYLSYCCNISTSKFIILYKIIHDKWYFSKIRTILERIVRRRLPSNSFHSNKFNYLD